MKLVLLIAYTSVILIYNFALFVALLFVSETVQLALVGSLVPTIAAVGAILIGWWSARNVAKAAAAAAEENTKKLIAVAADQKTVVEKADAIIEQGVQIHTLTNSNLSAANGKLDVANERIKGLEELIKAMLAAKTVADNLSTKKVEANASQPSISGSDATPTPVVDNQVADLLRGEVTNKLDALQDAVGEPPK